MDNVLSPRAIAAALTELWSPRAIAEVDEHYVKVARLQGALGWHSHEHEDELFWWCKAACASTWKRAR